MPLPARYGPPPVPPPDPVSDARPVPFADARSLTRRPRRRPFPVPWLSGCGGSCSGDAHAIARCRRRPGRPERSTGGSGSATRGGGLLARTTGGGSRGGGGRRTGSGLLSVLTPFRSAAGAGVGSFLPPPPPPPPGPGSARKTRRISLLDGVVTAPGLANPIVVTSRTVSAIRTCNVPDSAIGSAGRRSNPPRVGEQCMVLNRGARKVPHRTDRLSRAQNRPSIALDHALSTIRVTCPRETPATRATSSTE